MFAILLFNCDHNWSLIPRGSVAKPLAGRIKSQVLRMICHIFRTSSQIHSVSFRVWHSSSVTQRPCCWEFPCSYINTSELYVSNALSFSSLLFPTIPFSHFTWLHLPCSSFQTTEIVSALWWFLWSSLLIMLDATSLILSWKLILPLVVGDSTITICLLN